MTTRLRSSDGATTIVAAGLLAAAALQGVPTTVVFLAFTLLIAVSELFEVSLPNEVPYMLGVAPALGFVMLGSYDSLEVVLAFGLGATLALGIRALVRRPLRIPQIAAHTIALALAAGVYAQVAGLDHLPRFEAGDTRISPIGLVTMFVTILLVQSVLHSLRIAEQGHTRWWPKFRGQVRATAALQLSAVSVGALLALSYPSLDVYAFLLFLAPLAATQFAFRQFASIRTTYLQTIRALSKVPEMAGYTMPGHSTRVAELSVAIATELGIPEPQIDEIEYAALLHDIGRVSIPDPEDDQHAIPHPELAMIGANIVRETGHFPRVADMIEHQQDPYRRRGEDVDRDLPHGAKIIKVASAYDDLTRPGGIGLSSWDALEKLHLGMAYEYDPQVIQALTRALEKRGAI
ncbi:MAG TPA: HD domain-containing protein [Actinomycetota bacterium]